MSLISILCGSNNSRLLTSKMDSEAQAVEDDRKEYSVVRRIRTSNLAIMTKLYNELEKKMVSRENTDIGKNLYVKLCDRFEHFKTAHMECLDICADLEIVETLDMNFDNCKKNLMEFRERFSEWIKGKVTDDEEVCSRVRSITISSTSSKAKLRTARAKRLKVEHQLQKTKEKLVGARKKGTGNEGTIVKKTK